MCGMDAEVTTSLLSSVHDNLVADTFIINNINKYVPSYNVHVFIDTLVGSYTRKDQSFIHIKMHLGKLL